MKHQHEQELLNQYAAVAKSQVLTSQSDLGIGDVAMPDMLGWCRLQKTLVVLATGDILSSEPNSRTIRKCCRDLQCQ